MKVVVVDDRPWKMVKSIGTMRERGIEVNTVLYVCDDSERIDEISRGNIENLRNEFKDLAIETADKKSFIKKMSAYYDNAENMLLCDFNLSGNKREFFEKRVNVVFTRKIMEEGRMSEPPMRIWFYTTAGEMTNEQINENFPGRNISVKTIEEGQVILDVAEVLDALNSIRGEGT